MIALAAALAAGWLAAGAHAKRLRRLEAAAEKVAEGDFSTPIPDEGSDEVGQLASTFNEMQQRLARLDNARKEFIANASHELRTPIFSLGGFVELLDEDEPDPAARAEFVRTMREQVARLTKLTADLLDLSKLDADALEVNAEPVDLGELARRVAEEFGPAAERHRSADRASTATVSRWPWPTPIGWRRSCVSWSTTRSRTRRREPRSRSTAQREDGAASLVVTDDGPGIDPQARARVFDRFYTGDRVSGSGLGLAIARELALRMDGELGLASHRGRTEFTLRLPAAVAARSARLTARRAPAAALLRRRGAGRSGRAATARDTSTTAVGGAARTKTVVVHSRNGAFDPEAIYQAAAPGVVTIRSILPGGGGHPAGRRGGVGGGGVRLRDLQRRRDRHRRPCRHRC